jgi:hypothetical protein
MSKFWMSQVLMSTDSTPAKLPCRRVVEGKYKNKTL